MCVSVRAGSVNICKKRNKLYNHDVCRRSFFSCVQQSEVDLCLVGMFIFHFFPKGCTLRGTCCSTPSECTQQRDVVPHPTFLEGAFFLSDDSSPRHTRQTTPDVVLGPCGRCPLHGDRGCMPLRDARVLVLLNAVRHRNLRWTNCPEAMCTFHSIDEGRHLPLPLRHVRCSRS